jgi:hypothetical protein
MTALLSGSRKAERPIEFYHSADAGVAERFQANKLVFPSFDLNHLKLAYDNASVSGKQVKVVVTAREAYSYAVAIPVPSGDLPDPSWVSLRCHVISGQIGVGILDDAKNDFLTRQFIDAEDHSETIFLPLAPGGGPRTLIVENGVNRGKSTVELEDLQVITGDPAVRKP